MKVKSTIFFFLLLVGFFSINTKSLFAYESCDTAVTDLETFTICSWYGKTQDSYIAFTEGGNDFVLVFPSQHFEVYQDGATTTASTTSTNYDNYGSLFFASGAGGGEVQTYSILTTTISGMGGSYDFNGLGFSLDFYFSAIDETYAVQDVGCYNTASIFSCAFSTSTYAIAIQATTSSLFVEPWKYEYLMTFLKGVPIEPQSAYSKSTQYGSIGFDARTDPIVLPDKEKRVYVLRICNSPINLFPIMFGDTSESLCYTVYLGNGYESAELDSLLFDMGILSSTTQASIDTVWNDNECSDIGLTDVFKAFKCGMIWAFSPSQDSLQAFSATKTKILQVYPIGYATLILSDLASSTNSTSTAYFDKDINFGRWFGVSSTASTTISTSALLVHTDMGSTLFDMISILMWIGFVTWLLVYALTRTL